jgi:hypothetical protein
VIITVLNKLKSQLTGTQNISITLVIQALKDTIIEEYDATSPSEDYKDIWLARIKDIGARHNFELVCLNYALVYKLIFFNFSFFFLYSPTEHQAG